MVARSRCQPPVVRHVVFYFCVVMLDQPVEHRQQLPLSCPPGATVDQKRCVDHSRRLMLRNSTASISARAAGPKDPADPGDVAHRAHSAPPPTGSCPSAAADTAPRGSEAARRRSSPASARSTASRSRSAGHDAAIGDARRRVAGHAAQRANMFASHVSSARHPRGVWFDIGRVDPFRAHRVTRRRIVGAERGAAACPAPSDLVLRFIDHAEVGPRRTLDQPQQRARARLCRTSRCRVTASTRAAAASA